MTAGLGPILFVTSTNHALDQMLEHLVNADVEQIIRLSSSKLLAKGESLTRLENIERCMHQHNADRFRGLVDEGLSQLQNFSDALILDFLQEKHPRYYVQLVDPELGEDGIPLVKGERAHHGIAAWLQGTPMDSDTRAQMSGSTQTYDIFSLETVERQCLHAGWKEEIVGQLRRSLLANLKAYQDAKAESDKIGAEIQHRILASANVIAVTASELARNLDFLRRLNSKVLLVQEAGEVPEAQLLTAMPPSIEHAVLIGTYQELRPRASPRSLVPLNVSLFERLIGPKENQTTAWQFATLKVQHRMHPTISALIRSTIDVQDSPEVATYPKVAGMPRRLFWLDHSEAENIEKDHSDSTSHTNNYEVDMVFALVRHLVRQGVYRPSDIAILTPYPGQLRKLRRALSSFVEVIINDRDVNGRALVSDDVGDDILRGVSQACQQPVHSQAIRLATVDNFQGEEAKVVIISLVRSNKGKCGFLRTSNRISVLLSRAQHGMYIIGNTDAFAHVPMWADVLESLETNGNVGPQLELHCPRHPEDPLQVTKPDDFLDVSPERGCRSRCGKFLPCGHMCVKSCHSDELHRATKCTKPPNTAKGGCSDSSHSECGGQCGEHCIIQASKIDAELPCGHHVNSQNPAQMVCSVPVQRIVPGCDHKVTLPCFVDVTAPDYDCRATCGSLQPCGHACGDQCCKCRPRVQGRAEQEQHSECKQACQQDYTSCKHSCSAPCHGDEACPPCNEPSDVHWETTKDFIVWSHQNYLELARNIQQEQAELIDTKLDAPRFDLVNVEMAEGSKVDLLSELPGVNGRYDKLANLLRDCNKFFEQAVADEMPLKSVYVGVVGVLRSGGRSVDASGHDHIPLQTRGTILAMSLILRCEILGIIDSLAIYHAQEHEQRRSLDVDFSSDRDACEKLIEYAELSQDILQQVEGHVFWAQLAVLEFGVMEGRNSYEEIRALARSHIDNARELCSTYPRQTRSVKGEGREVSRLLAEGENDFQTRMVVAAMANDFAGTGNWYRCENGHPFTLSESGMSVQTARCHQCDAPIGGQNHAPAAGVQSPGDIERRFANLR